MIENSGAAQSVAAEKLEDKFSKAVATEVARLKADGYSKAYICERSFDIEDTIRRGWR